jgi:hypothetical protein
MRTSLQVSCVQDFDALKLAGSVTHKTNGVAVEGILQTVSETTSTTKGDWPGVGRPSCVIFGEVLTKSRILFSNARLETRTSSLTYMSGGCNLASDTLISSTSVSRFS